MQWELIWPTWSTMSGSMASSTRGSIGVVACMSRYMGGTPQLLMPFIQSLLQCSSGETNFGVLSGNARGMLTDWWSCMLP